MQAKFLRLAAVALVSAATAAPAIAGPGWRHGYHGYYGPRWGHYHGGSSGWWIGGGLALLGAGALIAINSRPAYRAPAVIYTAPPVTYGYPPAAYGPAYSAAAPGYVPEPVPPQAQYAPAAPPPLPEAAVQAAAIREAAASQGSPAAECRRQAMNRSGFDPSYVTRWTTQASVDSYNRAYQACMAGAGAG